MPPGLLSHPAFMLLQSRYQIHNCEVSAVDCAADGATIASGGSDGHIVLWSHVTGFKLAVFTVHSNTIRSLAFNHGELKLLLLMGLVDAQQVPMRPTAVQSLQHSYVALTAVALLNPDSLTYMYCVPAASYQTDATLLAGGDTDGVVSTWDVAQSCLLAAAQVHEGYVSSCCWSSSSSLAAPAPACSGGSSVGGVSSSNRELSVISCSYDSTMSVLQV